MLRLFAGLLLFCLLLVQLPTAVSAQRNGSRIAEPADLIDVRFKRKTLTCSIAAGTFGRLKTKNGQSYFISAKKKLRKKIRRAKRRGDFAKQRKLRKKYKKKRKACKQAIKNIQPHTPAIPEITNPSQLLGKYQGPFDLAAARHLYQRAAYSASAETVNTAVRAGLAQTLDDLFTTRPTPALDQEYIETISSTDKDTGEPRVRTWLMDQGQLLRFLKSPNQLQEKLFYFWHDKFSAAERASEGNVEFMRDYIDILRSEALDGNLRSIAKRMTVNGLMLRWLDGENNVVGNLNENYAREFWELFTLGHGQYSEQDVIESARSLTGWAIKWDKANRTHYVAFEENDYDDGDKTLFADQEFEQIGSFDAFALVDATLDANPAAAEYLAKTLLEFFIEKNPNPQVVAELAAYVRVVDFQIAPLVRTILSSNYFFNASVRKNRVKTPLEFSVGFLREVGFDYFDRWFLNEYTTNMGLDVLNPPSVKGWDDDTYWLNDQWTLNRLNFVYEALHRVNWNEREFDYASMLPRPGSNAAEFLDRAQSNLNLNLSGELRSEFLNYLKTVSWEEGQESELNFSEANKWELERKVVGTYYLLAHVPEYNLN